jgi:hypothetical protein
VFVVEIFLLKSAIKLINSTTTNNKLSTRIPNRIQNNQNDKESDKEK